MKPKKDLKRDWKDRALWRKNHAQRRTTFENAKEGCINDQDRSLWLENGNIEGEKKIDEEDIVMKNDLRVFVHRRDPKKESNKHVEVHERPKRLVGRATKIDHRTSVILQFGDPLEWCAWPKDELSVRSKRNVWNLQQRQRLCMVPRVADMGDRFFEFWACNVDRQVYVISVVW
nr:hypothetical protein CFP56_76876 [Quercus suber]